MSKMVIIQRFSTFIQREVEVTDFEQLGKEIYQPPNIEPYAEQFIGNLKLEGTTILPGDAPRGDLVKVFSKN